MIPTCLASVPAPWRLRGLYRVIPAHNIGAAISEARPVKNVTTCHDISRFFMTCRKMSKRWSWKEMYTNRRFVQIKKLYRNFYENSTFRNSDDEMWWYSSIVPVPSLRSTTSQFFLSHLFFLVHRTRRVDNLHRCRTSPASVVMFEIISSNKTIITVRCVPALTFFTFQTRTRLSTDTNTFSYFQTWIFCQFFVSIFSH